jgi:protein TonB
MRDPLSRSFAALQSSRDSWFVRVRENLRQFLTPGSFLPSSANGAPIHLPKWERSARAGRAQSVSFLTHAAMITAIALMSLHSFQATKPPENGGTKVAPGLRFPPHFLLSPLGSTPDSGSGSGGGRVPIPTTMGNLLPTSSIQIVRPSLPPQQDAQMPVPPTIFDPAATPVLTTVDKIGLPWMKDDTNSPGPGDSDTIGSSGGKTMGDGPRNGPGGQGDSQSRYRAGTSQPTCAYCPDPQYTDEAREARLQGAVTLLVLVGADGRAAQIRITQGIGMGLEERAVQAIRTWKFVPAHDAAHRAVPAWVTVEAVFRLF